MVADYIQISLGGYYIDLGVNELPAYQQLPNACNTYTFESNVRYKSTTHLRTASGVVQSKQTLKAVVAERFRWSQPCPSITGVLFLNAINLRHLGLSISETNLLSLFSLSSMSRCYKRSTYGHLVTCSKVSRHVKLNVRRTE